MVSSSSEPTLDVHGGWFRKAAREHDVQCDWEPVVIDDTVKDPQARFSLGRQGLPIVGSYEWSRWQRGGQPQSSWNNLIQRKLLMASPDELEISREMMQGSKPQHLIQKHARKLVVNIHKQILVHGYCSREAFPISHFTANRAISFSDPDSSNPTPQSIDLFARKIDSFADNGNVDGCGIIAHSQCRLAALHLYKNYWSCLDNTSIETRMIQSRGSPYKGKVMASVAAIGEVIGATCPYTCDLTG